MKSLVFVFFLLLSIFAQAQTDCGPAYQRIMDQADSDLKQGLFRKAFEGFRAARGCTKANLAYIDQQMSAALDSIELQRKKSVKNEARLQQTLKDLKATNAKLNKAQGELVKALEDAEAARDSAKQAESRALKLAKENEENLNKLQTANNEKIESLLRQAELLISRLNYDSVLLTVNEIHNFPGGKEKTGDLLFECAFFYGESGQMEKAREVFGLLGEKIDLNRKSIVAYLKAQNLGQYEALIKLYYPSFQLMNGGYFLSTFGESKEIAQKWKGGKRRPFTSLAFEEVYTPVYRLINKLIISQSPITYRQYYLYSKSLVPLWANLDYDEQEFLSSVDFAKYLNWLSIQFEKSPVYIINLEEKEGQNKGFFPISTIANANGFRLTTKEEWEYALKKERGQILDLKSENSIPKAVRLLESRSKKIIMERPETANQIKIWGHNPASEGISHYDLTIPYPYTPANGLKIYTRIVSNDF